MTAWGGASDALGDLPPPPDPPGSRRVPVEVEIDWGPFEHRLARIHTVTRGETLGAISDAYYGSKAHWKAIAKANPEGVAPPDRIAASTSLWIPPKAGVVGGDAPAPFETAEGEPLAAAYVALWIVPRRRGNPTLIGAPVVPDEKIPSGGTIWLVPEAAARPHLETLARRQVDAPKSVANAALRLYVATNPLIPAGDDRTARLRVQVRVRGVAKRVVEAEGHQTRVDADGNALQAPQAKSPVPGPSRSPGLVATSPEPADDSQELEGEPTRWPRRIGVLVAVLGLLIVGGVVLARQWKQTGDA
jgi:LysM repeat protein